MKKNVLKIIIIIVVLLSLSTCRVNLIGLESSNKPQDTSFVNVDRLDSIFKGYEVKRN